MEVILSVGGRFHGFNLAQQLFKRGFLKKIITSYPKFAVARFGVPPDLVHSIILKEVLERGWRRLPGPLKRLYNPQFILSEFFDKSAARMIEKADIFVGFSNFSLHSFERADKLGAIKILERGSSHMLYQQEIMRKEYNNFSISGELAHPKIIEKELKEYERADYISIPSLFVKRTFLEKGVPEKKLIHIPYGVDLAQFKQVPKDDNVFRVMFAGGMTLRKGVHYLLKAFAELNLPNSELMLIGSFNEEIKPFFKKYEGKFKWIGHIPQKELHKYYSQGSVFAIMSLEEGLAMVQPQAMASGLPIICTTNTGGEDIIRDGKDGFVIPIRDVEALKEKLLYLYQNPEICKAMGQSAKEKVGSSFTWDDYGEKIVKAYENILAKKS